MAYAFALQFDLSRDDVSDLILIFARNRLRLEAFVDDRMQYLDPVGALGRTHHRADDDAVAKPFKRDRVSVVLMTLIFPIVGTSFISNVHWTLVGR